MSLIFYALIFIGVLCPIIKTDVDTGELPREYLDWALSLNLEVEDWNVPISNGSHEFYRQVSRKVGESVKIIFRRFRISTFCLWVRNWTSLLLPSARYTYQWLPSDGNCDLQINGVTFEDSGVYFGVAYSFLTNRTAVSLKQNLTVLVPPSSPVFIYNGTVYRHKDEIHVGSIEVPFTIRCETYLGYPHGYTAWTLSKKSILWGDTSWSYDDDSGLYNTTNTLDIALDTALSQQLMDQQLNCITIHPAYNAPRSSYVILKTPGYTTMADARFRNHYELRELTVPHGIRVSMYCIANGEPHPRYFWRKKKENGQYTDAGKEQNLTVYADYGSTNYECNAKNNDTTSLYVRSELTIKVIGSLGTRTVCVGYTVSLLAVSISLALNLSIFP